LATERVERKLAAILAADVAGYSRLMGADEEGTLARLKALRRELGDPKIKEHRGRIVKTTGDGMLVEFPSVVDAVRCAVEVQRAMLDRNAEIPEDKRIVFRMGVNLGDVILDGDDIYGDGVNIAARLETLAEPGGICISRVVRDQIRDKLPYSFTDIGEQSVKNIARPVRAYGISAAAVASTPLVAASASLGRGRSLRRLIIPSSAIAVLCIAIAAWWVWPKGTPPAVPMQATAAAGAPNLAVAETKPAPRLSIVVLPFTNLSNDPEQEYFTDGITDDLTTDLSRIAGSFVIARSTAFTYKGKPIDAKQIGRELGVRYVLEGSVRRTGDQVRVNAQLIDAETGAHLWADRFDTDRANLPQVQNEITSRLARTVDVELVKDVSRRIEQEKAINPDARDLVMRGWSWLYRAISKETRSEALRAFERALELDARSVDARIGIATVLVLVLGDGMSDSPAQDEKRADQLLGEVLESDPDRQMAHAVRGQLRRLQNRVPEARTELEAAIALDPNNTYAHQQLGWTLMHLGDPAGAITQAEMTIRQSPRDPAIFGAYALLGWSHLLSNEVDQAIEWLVKARAVNPRIWYVHYALAGALGLKGDVEGAKASLADLQKTKPEINSIANSYVYAPFLAYPSYRALIDKTINEGLRRVGFPET
jgi:TolB-like protein/class 3 adenylate cyclase/Tfp pilus assembly protein PilF